MVNFGSIPRFLLTQRHFGYRTGQSMFVLYHFLFYLYIQSAEAYMGKARTLRKNCSQRQNENEKRTETTGKQRAKPDCLGADEEEAGKVVPVDGLGHPGYHGLATSSEAALVAEELFFCTLVPKIPPAWAECISQPSGYYHHEAQSFLAQYTIKPTGDWCCYHAFETRTGARAPSSPHGWPRGITETRPKLHGLLVIHVKQ